MHATRGHQPANGTNCLAASFSTLRSIESSRLPIATGRGPLWTQFKALTLPPLAGNPSAAGFAADDAMPRTFAGTLPS